MAEKNAEIRLKESIDSFLEVYKFLSTQAKIAFEIEIAKKSSKMDERTRNLYLALIEAAKDGLNTKEAIERMSKIG